MALPDTFTGANGTTLQIHDVLWVRHPSFSVDCDIQSNTCKVKAGGTSAYYYNQAPSSADYDVSVVVNYSSTSNNQGGPCGRMLSGVNSFYHARTVGANVELYKFVGGTATMLGTAVASGITTGVNATLTLSMSGTSIRVLVDGVVKISVTDSSLASAGFSGLRILASATNVSLDDFNFVSASATQMLTPGLFVNTNTFYGPTVVPGAVTLSPSLFTNTNTFYSPDVVLGTVTILPDLFQNQNVFYSTAITQPSTQVIEPPLFVNRNIIYSPSINDGSTRNIGAARGSTARTPALVIVEIDGIEYRVYYENLESFLAAHRKETKEKIKRKAKTAPVELLPAFEPIRVKQVEGVAFSLVQDRIGIANKVFKDVWQGVTNRAMMNMLESRRKQQEEEEFLLLIM